MAFRKGDDGGIEEYIEEERILRVYTIEEFDAKIAALDASIRSFDPVVVGNAILARKQEQLAELMAAQVAAANTGVGKPK